MRSRKVSACAIIAACTAYTAPSSKMGGISGTMIRTGIAGSGGDGQGAHGSTVGSVGLKIGGCSGRVRMSGTASIDTSETRANADNPRASG